MKLTKHPIDPVIVVEDPSLNYGEEFLVFIGKPGTRIDNNKQRLTKRIMELIRKGVESEKSDGAGFQNGGGGGGDGMSGFRG